jgi:hypothetical protein
VDRSVLLGVESLRRANVARLREKYREVFGEDGSDQVAIAGGNFGEVGICQRKMLSNNALRAFRPPQLCDR